MKSRREAQRTDAMVLDDLAEQLHDLADLLQQGRADMLRAGFLSYEQYTAAQQYFTVPRSALEQLEEFVTDWFQLDGDQWSKS